MRTLALILILTIASGALAQVDRARDKREQIAAQKVAFLTQKMELTPEESKVFWPVYEEHERELSKIRNEKREKFKIKGRNLATMNDDEVEELIDAELILKQDEVDLRWRYHDRLKKLVGPRKVALLYQGEKEFHRELLQRMRDQKRERE